MKKALNEAKGLFESITCLCAEGPEFMNKLELVDVIGKEAGKGYNLCKAGLQQAVVVERAEEPEIDFNMRSGQYCHAISLAEAERGESDGK